MNATKEIKKVMCGSSHTESENYFCHILLELNDCGYDKLIKKANKDFKTKIELMQWIALKCGVEFDLKDIVRSKETYNKMVSNTAKTDNSPTFKVNDELFAYITKEQKTKTDKEIEAVLKANTEKEKWLIIDNHFKFIANQKAKANIPNF